MLTAKTLVSNVERLVARRGGAKIGGVLTGRSWGPNDEAFELRDWWGPSR